MRHLTLILAAAVLSACASDRDVQMQDPRTGETATCAGHTLGVDPWSQTYACVAQHSMQGWVVTGKE